MSTPLEENEVFLSSRKEQRNEKKSTEENNNNNNNNNANAHYLDQKKATEFEIQDYQLFSNEKKGVEVKNIDEFSQIMPLSKYETKQENKETHLTFDETKVDKYKSFEIEDNDEGFKDSVEITPYSESQLKSLYSDTGCEDEEDQTTETYYQNICYKYQNSEFQRLFSFYFDVTDSTLRTRKDLRSLDEKMTRMEDSLWIFSKSKISEFGICQDGKKVIGTFESTTCTLNDFNLTQLKDLSSQKNNYLTQEFSNYAIQAEITRLKISDSLSYIRDKDSLKTALGVLFSFLKGPLINSVFLQNIQNWCDELVRQLFLSPTNEDRLFLVHHVIRCSRGHGAWTSKYIQIPSPDSKEPLDINHPYLKLLCKALTILMSSKKVEASERKRQREKDRDRDLWVIYDSEGDEEAETQREKDVSLLENDVMGFLNQIPFCNLLKYLLRISIIDGKAILDSSHSSESSCLQHFVFFNELLRIFKRGLITYSQYPLLVKKLSQNILNFLLCLSTHWDLYKENKEMTSLCLRLQVEFDYLVCRSQCILMENGCLYYLPSLPFETISLSMLWKLFYRFHFLEVIVSEDTLSSENWENLPLESDFLLSLEEKLSTNYNSLGIFVLTTLCSMALSRNWKTEKKFILRVSLTMFHLGFVSSSTRENASKDVRDLLSNLSTTHTSILSSLLYKCNETCKTSSIDSPGIFYCIKKLPWKLFTPTSSDVALLNSWLMHSSLTSELSSAARFILSHLNWKSNVLISYHQKLGITIGNASQTLAPESIISGFLSESFKHVSSIVMSTSSPETSWRNWAWETISKLHLHESDGGSSSLSYISDSSLESLRQGVKNGNPLSAYISLLVSSNGSNLSDFLSTGLSSFSILLQSRRTRHISEVFLHVFPLLLSAPPGFFRQNETLTNIIKGLFDGENSFGKMARDLLISSSFPSPLLKEMSLLLPVQLSLHHNYGITDKRPLLQLWFRSMVSIENWRNNQNILYMLDLLCQESFQDRELILMTLSIMEELIETDKPKENSGLLSSWTSSITHKNEAFHKDFPYLSFYLLSLEETKQLTLWTCLINLTYADKASVEEAFNEASKPDSDSSFSSPFSLTQLNIFSWAFALIETPLTHPLIAIFAQKFFSHYYVATYKNLSNGIGAMMIVSNSVIFEKIKEKLFLAVTHFTNSEDPYQLKYLFEFFSSWINNSHILSSPSHTSLSSFLCSSVLPEKLKSIFENNNEILWFELIDRQFIIKDNSDKIKEWNFLHFRETVKDNQKSKPCDAYVKSQELRNKKEKSLLQRLLSIETSISKLSSNSSNYKFLKDPFLSLQSKVLTQPSVFLKILHPALESLVKFAKAFSKDSLEILSLSHSYYEFLPILWNLEKKESLCRVSCSPNPSSFSSSSFSSSSQNEEKCQGEAIIRFKFQEAVKNERIWRKMTSHREGIERISNKILEAPMSQENLESFVFLDKIINHILNTGSPHVPYNPKQDENQEDFEELGILLFYEFVQVLLLCEEEIVHCSPLRSWLSFTLEKMSQSLFAFKETRILSLLKILNEHPETSSFILSSFTPNIGDSHLFLTLYQIISELYDSKHDELSFTLMSKLSVKDWLKRCKPNLQERTQCISMIGVNFSRGGMSPNDDRVLFHNLIRKQVSEVLFHSFLEHYEEILSLYLKLSEALVFDPEIWNDLLNHLMDSCSKSAKNLRSSVEEQDKREENEEEEEEEEKIKNVFSEIARLQILLSFDVIENSVILLSQHFRRERLTVGLHGFYSKYYKYVKPLTGILGFLSHCLVAACLRHGKTGNSGNELMYQLWYRIYELYHPWLVPLSENDRSQTASWIQQLASSSQALLPWAPGDAKYALTMAKSFVNVIFFLHEILPSKPSAISLTWSEFYCKQFATPTVKDYVLTVIHSALLTLPWNTFEPSVMDVELMVRVMDLFIPLSHTFIGQIFGEISWSSLSLTHVSQNNVMNSLLFKIIIKLAAEPRIRQIGRLHSLLHEMESYPWWTVDSTTFENLIQWYVMSVDCKVILPHEARHPLDTSVLRLLEIASGYRQENEGNMKMTMNNNSMRNNNNMSSKHGTFIKAAVRLLLSCGAKHKNFLQSHLMILSSTLAELLQDLEMYNIHGIHSSETIEKVSLSVRDYLSLLNAPPVSDLPKVSLSVLLNWLKTSNASTSFVVSVLLSSVGRTLDSPRIFCQVTEGILESFFSDETSSLSWPFVLSILEFPHFKDPLEFFEANRGESHILLMSAYYQKYRPMCESIKEEERLLSILSSWFLTLQIKESNESKLPLVYKEYCILLHRQSLYGKEKGIVVEYIYKFVDYLTSLTTTETGAVFVVVQALRGLLTSRSLSSSSYKLSPRGKFLALSLSVYLLSQVSENQGIREKERDVFENSHLKSLRFQLMSLKEQQAFLGLHDLIDSSLISSSEKSNDLEASVEFIKYLVTDKLYLEPYLKL